MVLSMLSDFLRENPITQLVGSLVLILAGLAHIFNPQSQAHAVGTVLTMLNVSLPSVAIQAVGVGVLLIGLGMANMLWMRIYG